MSVRTRHQRRPLSSYPVSLQLTALALWGDLFWERETVAPDGARHIGKPRPQRR